MRVLAAFLLAAALAAVGAATYYHLYLTREEQLSCRVAEDVVAINDLHSSLYLVKTQDGYLAVDAGMFSGIVRRGLEYQGIDPERVLAVFLTHADPDHRGAIGVFPRAAVYLSRAEDEMVREGVRRLPFLPLSSNRLERDPCAVVEEGDRLVIGGRSVECLALPGHTPGSMGYVVDGRYLFSGDAFRIKNGKLQVPVTQWFAMDIHAMERTLRKVAQLQGVRYVFSAHSGFTADFDYAVADWK
jgi:hydroxyacylglutathione hydrolase